MAANSTTTSAAKVETVTLRQLAETLSESHELPKKQVMSMLEEMVTTVTKHLKRGARIRIDEGPFSSHDAIFEMQRDDERVVALLSLLGRQVVVQLPATAVAPAS